MRLYTSGVKVPKLYSIQDRVLRQFQILETRKNLQLGKIISQAAIGTGNRERDWFNSINSTWNDYVNLECGVMSEIKNREEDMVKEYERYRHLRPKMFFGKDGSLQVTGVDIN